MKKLFNIRLPLTCAALLASGIAFAVLAEYFRFSSAWLLLPVAVGECAVAFFCVRRKNSHAFFVVSLCAVFFVVGVLYAGILVFNYNDSGLFTDGAVMICGTVEDVGLTSKGTRYVLIDGVSFGDTPVNGKLIAYFLENAGEYCRRGYKVSMYSQPEALEFFADGSVSYYAARGIKYSCVVAGSLQAKYAFSPFGEVAYKIEELLFDNIDGETASVALALLTGNADKISSGTLSAFRGGGIAHAFAVSGLHVGVVYGALTALLKKLPLHRIVSVVIRLSVIFAFVGVCNFTPSSMRAAIMCSVSAIAPCLNCRYDSLNGVAVAAIIILLINPFALFEVGFILSFSAVSGIFLLYRSFYSRLYFLPRKLRSGVATGWSAQFATVPSLAVSFGNVSWAGLILNLVFVPAISAYFVLLFASVILCLLAPFCASVLLPAVAVPLQLIINLVVVSGVENAVITCNVGAWIYLPFAFAIFAMSDKVNLTYGVRLAILGLVCVAVTCFSITPDYGKGSTITFSSATDGGYAVISNSQGTILVVTQNVDGVPRYVTESSDALVVVGGDDSLSAIANVNGDFKQIYINASVGVSSGLTDCTVVGEDAFTLYGVDFKYIGNSLLIGTEGVVVAVTCEEKGEPYGRLPQGCSVNMYSYGNYDAVLFFGDCSYDLGYCGDIRFYAGCGKITAIHAAPKE